MELIELICEAGPFGDGMYVYDVIIKRKGATVADLINYVVNKKGDWGYIGIKGIPEISDYNAFEYRWGEVVKDSIPDQLKDSIIQSIKARGGWSNMDYVIELVNSKKAE